MKNKKNTLKVFAFILIFPAALCFSQNKDFYGAGTGEGGSLSQGESLFKENNAKDAVQVLEYEIQNGTVSANTYNFLGLGYYQLGDFEKSIDAFRRGLKAQPDNVKLLSYNLGNTYYAMKSYEEALQCYSDSLNSDPFFYEALLNRANALLMLDRLVSAKEDYVEFVTKCPDDPQHEKIELLIAALDTEIARREEEARLLAEQEKAKWEEFDGALAEKKDDDGMPDWEEIDGLLEKNSVETVAEWERINSEQDPDISEVAESAENSGNEEGAEEWEELTPQEKIAKTEEVEKSDKVSDELKKQWETIEKNEVPDVEEKLDDEELLALEDWEDLGDEQLEEIKALDEESRRERENWLKQKQREEEDRIARENAQRLKEKVQAEEDERKRREELLEELRKSEEDRRKKLLEDVANSLQNGESTNLTSGAEDLMDYDLEGELD